MTMATTSGAGGWIWKSATASGFSGTAGWPCPDSGLGSRTRAGRCGSAGASQSGCRADSPWSSGGGDARREQAGGAGPQHGLSAGAGWRLAGPRAGSLNLRLEAAVRDAANDAAVQTEVGLRLTSRFQMPTEIVRCCCFARDRSNGQPFPELPAHIASR